MNPLIRRCYDRWYALKPHPVQIELCGAVPSGVRFPLVRAGRRSGKTERYKRFVARMAMRNDSARGPYFAAAPTHDQAKKVFWNDLKLLTFSPTHPKKPSETERIIFLPNGNEIHVLGLDRPERFEGIPWVGGGIDEIANVKEKAINENIMPALDTEDPTRPGHKAWCWFLGVPEGLGHYYDMCCRAESGEDKESRVYHWKSSEILSPESIASAKARMSARQFRQEYEASFETAEGRIYDDYSAANHTSEEILLNERLVWCHDQNFTPLSSAIGVIRGKNLYLLDEIVLTSAVSRQSAIEFVERYKDHGKKEVWIYGDPHGRVGEKHGHQSDYTEIESVLRNAGWQLSRKVPGAAPAIKDRQNAVRAKILNAAGERSLFVNPAKCRYVDKGLATVQLKKGSSFQEDEGNEYQHITTAIGYMCHYEWPVNGQITEIKVNFTY